MKLQFNLFINMLHQHISLLRANKVIYNFSFSEGFLVI